MTIAKTQQQDTLNIREVPPEKVKRIRYLGTSINDNNDNREEINMIIGQARALFNKIRSCAIISSIYNTKSEHYACVLRAALGGKPGANIEVLSRMKKGKEVMNTIKIRRFSIM